jgi:hypothetical protein
MRADRGARSGRVTAPVPTMSWTRASLPPESLQDTLQPRRRDRRVAHHDFDQAFDQARIRCQRQQAFGDRLIKQRQYACRVALIERAPERVEDGFRLCPIVAQGRSSIGRRRRRGVRRGGGAVPGGASVRRLGRARCFRDSGRCCRRCRRALCRAGIGVRKWPSALGTSVAAPSRQTPTRLLVVPSSIPTIIARHVRAGAWRTARNKLRRRTLSRAKVKIVLREQVREATESRGR